MCADAKPRLDYIAILWSLSDMEGYFTPYECFALPVITVRLTLEPTDGYWHLYVDHLLVVIADNDCEGNAVISGSGGADYFSVDVSVSEGQFFPTCVRFAPIIEFSGMSCHELFSPARC